MVEIVNLRRARKRVERMKKGQQATENAAKFGRSHGEALAERQAREKAARHLDQHRCGPDDG